MQLLSETIKHIYSTQQVSSLSAIPFYQDHAPEGVDYPIITFKIITNNPSMAMGTTGNDYAEFTTQFNVYVNEQQYSNGISYLQGIEDLYHRKTDISLNNNVTLICSKVKGGNISFYNQNEKIWQLSEDFTFMVGK